MTCKAYRSSEQMICGPCGLQWDVTDPERPACRLGQSERTVEAVITLPPEMQADTADPPPMWRQWAVRCIQDGDVAVRVRAEHGQDAQIARFQINDVKRGWAGLWYVSFSVGVLV